MRGTCCAWILWRCAVIAVGSCAGAKAVDWRHVRIVGRHFCYWFVMDSPSNGIFSLGSLEWQKAGGSISLGKWAVPSYLLFAFLLLLLILFRFIQKTMAAPAEARVWLFIFAIFFTLIYAAAAYIALFFVVFFFFPFAP